MVSVSGWSDLLTTMMSGISITPAFNAWMESPEPGISTSTTESAWSITSTSACPTPTVSRNTSSLPAASISSAVCSDRLGEPAERAPGRHRADEHARVEEVLGQPDPVAQQRAAAEGRRGIDRQHRDLAVLRPLVADQRADQRGLARARRTGEADDRGVAGPRIDLLHQRPPVRLVVLDQRDATRQRALVAVQEPLRQIRHRRRRIVSVGDGDGLSPHRRAPDLWRPGPVHGGLARALRFLRSHRMLNA